MPVPPEVTVVIPTRDRWPEPTLAVRQALEQEDVAVEVHVVDDGSRQPLAPRLRGPGDAVRVLRNPAPAGVARSRNAGIREARGEWTAFLDDDDLWSPRKLRAQLDAASSQGGAWAYGGAIDLDGRSGEVGRPSPAPDPGDVGRLLLARNVIPGGSSNVLARTEVLREIGGFDEDLSQLADWDLWIRLALTAPAAACEETLVAYVLHGENMVLSDPDAICVEIELLEAKHAAARRSRGVELDRLAIHRWIAWGHRRAGRRLRAATAYARGGLAMRRPGELARALGALLGERAMAAGARAATEQEPAWLTKHELRRPTLHESDK